MAYPLSAQQYKDSLVVSFSDTLKTKKLDEVVIIANPSSNYLRENKALGSLDSYLESSSSINMIRRGAYAWEPMLNGMATERSVVTIDGMRIFQACTDKMDPVTSYVENTNLSRAKINDGQSGTEFGGTIAGSIDLMRRKSGFNSGRKSGGSAFVGFESNNKQQIYGSTLNYSDKRFFTDIDFTHREADNYRAGFRKGQSSEVNFSQFTKNNLSAITGFKINENQELQGSLIYDKATDVGYPGLPMDASLAKATIASLEYRYRIPSKYEGLLWETKIYFNTITHVMDDSHRPSVPMHMDMPGWSKTKGFYTKLKGNYKNQTFSATLSGYKNNSLAEMTMYPENPREPEMFMLTWPDVNTMYSGLNVADNISFSSSLGLLVQGGLGMHQNKIASESGLNSLQLFYPKLKSAKTRMLRSLYSEISYQHKKFLYQFGIGYGDRAPSVSEGYGFYLLNVNDNYDYVGNPDLKNEETINFNAAATFETAKVSVKGKVTCFYITDYIIPKKNEGISPMSMGANGVKIYEQLNHASILNAGMNLDYKMFTNWIFSANASYRYGEGTGNTILPLMQPFVYKMNLRFARKSYFAEASVEGSSKNRNSIEFGETQKPGYFIANAALSKNFVLGNQKLILKLGVENLFDRYYSTFDDWSGIPRMGRNIYSNLIFKF